VTREMVPLVALFLLAATSGCATIISGTTQRIGFESTPPGAQLHIDGGSYTTPAQVKLSRAKNYEVDFEKDEYLPATRQVTRGTNGWVFGNILIGGIIGLLVDYSTGAANKLEPDVVRVELVRKPSPPASQQDRSAQGQARRDPQDSPSPALPRPQPRP
jgi:hypothetical protein